MCAQWKSQSYHATEQAKFYTDFRLEYGLKISGMI